MQESRLFRIVYYLIEKGKSTAPELAQKFEVSARRSSENKEKMA